MKYPDYITDEMTAAFEAKPMFYLTRSARYLKLDFQTYLNQTAVKAASTGWTLEEVCIFESTEWKNRGIRLFLEDDSRSPFPFPHTDS